jgi:peptide/nickel transport system ATP-binding protein
MAKQAQQEHPPVLEVRGLSVTLPPGADRKYAVEDISLTVGRGEIVCVVGESGSGKSVTAQTVMGLIPRKELTPVAGEALLQGEDLLKKSEAALRELRGVKMAMIFQEPMTALNPVMRVGDQIGEMLEIHTQMSARPSAVPGHRGDGGRASARRQPDDRQLSAPAVRRPAPAHHDRHGTGTGTGAAYRRRADHGAGRDHAGADPRPDADMQKRHGTGVLFITHDFGVVAEIADRVVVMQNGKVVEQGTAQQVLNKPREPYTKMLIGSVPSMVPPKRKAITRGEPILAARALEKIYGSTGWFGSGRTVHAAKQVELEVRRGETLGVVGESGSGKSTVARCIVRLIDPTSGEVLIDGTNIATMPQSQLRSYRRDVQVVFQDPYRSLNPRRTVGQSIIEGPMNFGISHQEAMSRAGKLMEIVGLSATALDRFPHQFSGGQRQRICIARALAMEPKVLIADEAVSALDVSVQAQVLKLLDDVRKQFDLAMLFITHDLRVAAQICDRIMVMQHGEVVEQGATASVYAKPQHAYTRQLLEAAPGQGAFAGGVK